MITRAQITQRAERDGVSAQTVERDYVLAHIIAGFASLEDNHGVVFKGGTALRLCHFENYRYSADLDFSMIKGNTADGYEVIHAALGQASGIIENLYLTTDKSPARIAYTGPLAPILHQKEGKSFNFR